MIALYDLPLNRNPQTRGLGGHCPPLPTDRHPVLGRVPSSTMASAHHVSEPARPHQPDNPGGPTVSLQADSRCSGDRLSPSAVT